MRFFCDFLIINVSAVIAFVMREYFGDFIVKQAPSIYLGKYLFILLLLNLSYPCIFWLLGLYDRRQKRALLEEFILIFGVFSTSIAILIIFLFLGRLWWMSRIVLFTFWGLSIFFLCLSRVFMRTGKIKLKEFRVDLSDLYEQLKNSKQELLDKLNDKISIIVVSTNEIEKTKQCLDSIKRADLRLPVEVIVINNCSMDRTEQILNNYNPGIKIITNREKYGYSKNVNLGLKASTAGYCLVLNPDINVIPGAIETMLNYMLKHPKVGIVGCRLFNEDGTLQYSVRRFLDIRTYLYRFTPLRGLMVGSAIERYYLMQDWDHNDNRSVDWVLGGCMLVRRKAFEEVGMMDERFFLYFDDVDWCFDMWTKGWQVAYVAEAAMFHKHMRDSANKLFHRATYEHFKSLLLFLHKHGFHLPSNAPSSLE